jgi:hypothetical protein
LARPRDRGLPIGSYVGEDGNRHKLGSRISEAAGRGGGNFLTPEIAHTARREAAYREIGALIDQKRLATNLLSSMPLTFNLLAPWGHTLERASSYLIELLPAFTGSARQLLFEHSPGRGNLKFTGDFTAFDALIRYSDAQGRNGFVAFEIKYSESMREPIPEAKPRHAELSAASTAAAALKHSHARPIAVSFAGELTRGSFKTIPATEETTNTHRVESACPSWG